ncbi:MAG: pilus assembly protein N-terminal domain-containing protein [Planctomycetes bacterium]|nr:pilus assembly protein N-terminal domain-containing protein [Planctomycetota bacterium]
MRTPVTDDRKREKTMTPTFNNHNALRILTVRHRAAVALVLAALAATRGGVAYAQSGIPAGGKDFKATVLDMSSETRSVAIPLNRSVIIQTSVEVARADVVNAQVANVQPVSATQLLVTGKNFGRTHVVLWDKTEKQYLLDIGVEYDLKPLNDALRAVDPQSSVEARSVMGTIVLSGTVSSAERAKRMVELAELMASQGAMTAGGATATAPSVRNHLDVAGEQQVLLRCVVAEVSRRAVRDLGINGFLAGENVRDAFVVNQIGGINPANIGAAADVNVQSKIPFLIGEEGIPLLDASTLSLGFPRVQMQMFIRALAENQLATVLAEPNLVAISGETASFLAGGEFPIPVPQGNQQVTIQFREFGVRLNFTPVVKAHQRIRLRVAPEVSELDFSSAVQIEGFVVPGLSSRFSTNRFAGWRAAFRASATCRCWGRCSAP